jgi:hypothetical protein
LQFTRHDDVMVEVLMRAIGVLKASPLRLSPRLALHACTGLGQEI